MTQDDYIVIQRWMVSELGLKGNELLIYALIYSFSRDGESEFRGSIDYVEKWTGVARNTVKGSLKKLVERNLVTKRDFAQNNVRYCAYKVVMQYDAEVGQKLPWGRAKIAPGGRAKIDPNIYNKDKHKDKKEINKESQALFDLFKSFCSKYRAYGGRVKSAQTEFENLKKKHKDWQEIIPMLDYALEKENKEREQATRRGDFFPVMKNLQTYINQRSWEMYSEGFEDYDPNEYHPNGYYVRYMERDDYYLYIGSYPDTFFSDGYKDTDRPDGATLVLNNARGTLIWRAATKTWELTR